MTWPLITCISLVVWFVFLGFILYTYEPDPYAKI